MNITASVRSTPSGHDAVVSTAGVEQRVAVAARSAGGSSVNGGEFLMLALATCYCNDLYQEISS